MLSNRVKTRTLLWTLLATMAWAAACVSERRADDDDGASTSGGASSSVPGGPVVLVSANPTSLTQDGSVIVTATVTDPDGPNDIFEGHLKSEDTGVAYLAFQQQSAGVYTLELPWLIAATTEPVSFTDELVKRFRAEFVDTTNKYGSATVDVTLNCGGCPASNGKCSQAPCKVCCSSQVTPACTQSVCNTGDYPGAVGECVIVSGEGACDDGTFCTTGDSCNFEGTCAGGPPNDCGMTPAVCKQILCNESSQSCSQTAVQNGTGCQNPSNLCIKGSTCSNGSCVGGMLDDCFSTQVPPCYVAVCNPANGQCQSQVVQNGTPCTGGSCYNGNCI